MSAYVKRHKRLPKLKKFKTQKDTNRFLKLHSQEYKRHLRQIKQGNRRNSQLGEVSVEGSVDSRNLKFLNKLKKSEKNHVETKFDFLFYTKALKSFISNKNNVVTVCIEGILAEIYANTIEIHHYYPIYTYIYIYRIMQILIYKSILLDGQNKHIYYIDRSLLTTNCQIRNIYTYTHILTINFKILQYNNV